MRALVQLDTVEGRSPFTAGVHRIAVRVALIELPRRFWMDISLEQVTETAPRLGCCPAARCRPRQR